LGVVSSVTPILKKQHQSLPPFQFSFPFSCDFWPINVYVSKYLFSFFCLVTLTFILGNSEPFTNVLSGIGISGDFYETFESVGRES
jgi:hypothetical protein